MPRSDASSNSEQLPTSLSPPLVIAVDGPAGAGKGTAAKRVADLFDFALLETGLLYRVAALKVLKQNKSPYDIPAATTACHDITPADIDGGDDAADDDDDSDAKVRRERHRLSLKTPQVAETASIISAHPPVREALLAYQRKFAARPPRNAKGAILDGRDIGTVVYPSATLKFFIDASPEERARRRMKEYMASGLASTFDEVLEDIKRRDERDRNRPVSPLVPASDSIILDTTGLSIDEVVDTMKTHIEKIILSSTPS